MKLFSSVFCIFILSFFSFSSVFWGDLDKYFEASKPSSPYCKDSENCGIQKWIEASKQEIEGIVTDGRKFSDYIQDVTAYILWFLYLIGVIMIIYAWFQLIVWTWDDSEKAKKSKTLIVYVIIWVTIIFLAAPIMDFLLNILWVSPSQSS